MLTKIIKYTAIAVCVAILADIGGKTIVDGVALVLLGYWLKGLPNRSNS